MSISLIPETAPFDARQRAWLNGFFAGLLGLQDPNGNGNGHSTLPEGVPSITALVPPPNDAPDEPEAEEFPWHDPALPIAERLQLAKDRPLERQLMAAMAQLDCGACGYVCKTYSEAIARGEERNLKLCSPGGQETAKTLRTLVKESGGENAASGASPSNGNGALTSPVSDNISQRQRYDRRNPFRARVVSSTTLNREGSAKDTRHVVVDLIGSGIEYEVGDSLGVYPTNCPELVEQVIDRLHADGDQPVPGDGGERPSLRELLLRRDLRDVDEDLAALVAASADESDAGRLRALLEDEDRLSAMDVLDLLEMAPSARVDVDRFVSALAPLAPRLYSIASSLLLHPNQVHLTVARATTLIDRRLRKGVASTMFADRVSPGDRVPVFVQPSHGFRPPADASLPIVMVGPGTGIAPFRAFLQERSAAARRGDAWLFFGDRHRQTDFLYEEELSTYLADGTLTRLDTAFSRDQEAKIYVQDRMRESGAELFRWLERGAHFYVCGDGRRMAVDVDHALRQIVAEHGDLSRERADDYVAELARTQRYLCDVY